MQPNKSSFFSKTKPPFTLNRQSRTEQIKSDKVEEALEASVDGFRKSKTKDLFTYQNLSSKTSSLRLKSQWARATKARLMPKGLKRSKISSDKTAHAQLKDKCLSTCARR